MLVVYYCEHLRDGTEDGAKIVADYQEAQELIQRFALLVGANMTFKLFELGKEIPIEIVPIKESQPPRLTGVQLVLKESK